MKHKWKKATPEHMAYFEKMTQGIDCEHRKMFGYPCCFLNGNMFAGVYADEVIVRLPETERLQALKRYPGAVVFEPQPGRRMKEYVSLPEKVSRDEKVLEGLLMKAVKYAASLPRKEKKKKK